MYFTLSYSLNTEYANILINWANSFYATINHTNNMYIIRQTKDRCDRSISVLGYTYIYATNDYHHQSLWVAFPFMSRCTRFLKPHVINQYVAGPWFYPGCMLFYTKNVNNTRLYQRILFNQKWCSSTNNWLSSSKLVTSCTRSLQRYAIKLSVVGRWLYPACLLFYTKTINNTMLYQKILLNRSGVKHLS
jgi:hypothetical protein